MVDYGQLLPARVAYAVVSKSHKRRRRDTRYLQRDSRFRPLWTNARRNSGKNIPRLKPEWIAGSIGKNPRLPDTATHFPVSTPDIDKTYGKHPDIVVMIAR